MGDIATGVVEAARAGDEAALERLVADSMSLVYNVVARAAQPDLDVDDVVQETMLQVVTGLPQLRQANRFRPWVISIALSRLSDARRQAGRRRDRTARWPEAEPPAAEDAGGRVESSAALDELQEASRWLDPAFRDLMSLWWLEVIGRIRRPELAAALGQSPAVVAVRVQRLRSQLDTARQVVRALEEPCAELAGVVRGWDGTAEPVWRKRIARHVRSCATCGAPRPVRAERLLALLPLLATPPALLPGRRLLTPVNWSAPLSAHPLRGPGPRIDRGARAGRGARVGRGARAGHSARAGRGALVHGAGAKAALAGLAIAVVAGGGTVTYLGTHRDSPVTRVLAAATPAPAVPAAGPSPAPGVATTPASAAAAPAPAASAATSSAAAPSATPKASGGYSSYSGRNGTFSAAVPALPAVRASALLGAVDQGSRVGDRDGGDSAAFGGRSYWVYADTTLQDPWGFRSNSAAVTTDLNAADGIQLRAGSAFSTKAAAPVTVIPHTAAETAFENAHNPARTGCTPATDQYCGAVFGYWPGEVVADPAHDRVLVFFGKICRMGGHGTPCADQWKNLGTGIAAIDLKTGNVTRLRMTGGTPVRSVEGVDPTLGWAAGQHDFTGSVVTDGILYGRGDCDFWHCASSRVPLADVTDLSAYRYWNGSAWVADPSKAVRTAAAGGSTFYDSALKLWMNVSLPWGSNDVIYQVAGRPQGPYSKTATAITVPAGNGVKYSMYVRTEYARDNGLTQYLTWYDNQSGDTRLARIDFARP